MNGLSDLFASAKGCGEDTSASEGVAGKHVAWCVRAVTNLLVEHIGRLVSMDDHRTTLVDAAIWIEKGVVAWMGKQSQIPDACQNAECDRIHARGQLVTPGLVDCHTHVVFGGDRRDEFRLRATGASYEDIAAAGGGIRSTMALTRGATIEELSLSALGRLKEMHARGVTSVEIKTGYGLSLESELKMLEVIRFLQGTQPMRLLATFLGAHTVPPEFDDMHEYARYVCSEMLPAVAKQGVAQFCDVFCERNVFDVDASRQVLEAGLSLGLRPKVHAEQLSWQGGTQLGVSLGAVSVDHLEYITDTDIELLANGDTVAVVLPGAAVTLNVERHAPARRLLDAGARVAIATDCNPGSSMCVDLRLMTTLATTLMGMTPDEAFAGVTCHAANALGRDDIGRLRVGAAGDLVIWRTDHEHNIPYRYGAVEPDYVIVGGVRS